MVVLFQPRSPAQKLPFFPFTSPSPAHYLFSKKSLARSPMNPSSNSTPKRFFKMPFPPPSPARHIKAVLARRHGLVKPNESGIPEGGGAGLDKSFEFLSILVIFALLSRSFPFDDGNKEVWLDRALQKGRCTRAMLLHKLPNHDLTMEVAWPQLYIDHNGKYWDVPESISLDCSSLVSESGFRKPAVIIIVGVNGGELAEN